MGELFKVMGISKGLEGPLLGFQSARHLPLYPNDQQEERE
jgi:hypothetical protein